MFLHILSIWWEVFLCKHKLEVPIKKQAIKSFHLCQLMSRFTHPLVVLRGPSYSDLAFVPREAASALWGILRRLWQKRTIQSTAECQD